VGNLRHQTLKGVMWSAIERFSSQGIQFILNIILARIVTPSEYGLIALLAIFMSIAQVFIDSGFSKALIQKNGRTETDYSTVFYFNIVVAAVIYALFFLSAPFIAAFYTEPQLTIITRWVSLNIVISSFSIVQRAKLTIKLDFKTQTIASFSSVVIGGIAGVVLACRGYGVWALVTQSIVTNSFNSLFLWIFTRWRPALIFSFNSFKTLFAFGSKLLLSGIMDALYINMYSLVIGKKYSAADVGYYNQAFRFSSFPSSNLASVINKAVYPVQCRLQDNNERLSINFHEYLGMSCYIIFPLMVGLAIMAEPLLLLMLTEKWLPVADLLSILCLAYMWYPVMLINCQILNVKGRSDYFLRAEIIKKVFSIGILILTIPLGLKALCFGMLIYNILDMIIIIFYSRKVIDTGFIKQIKTIAPIIVLNMVMAASILLLINIINDTALKLIVGIAIGILTYSIFSIVFCVKSFTTLLSMIKGHIL
jgi:O-antigen/teichoic acid export membrane protein